MKQNTVVGIGEILWDEFPDGKKMGGAPGNFAFHADQLGANALIISQIGHDEPGNKIQTLLNQNNISNILSIDPLHPTGKVSIKIDKNGSPQYIIHENAAWDYIIPNPDIEKIIPCVDALCYGTLAQRNEVSAETIQNFILSTNKNCLKIFDINLRQDYYSKNNIAKLMSLANIIKLNHEELEIVAKMLLSQKTETGCLKELKSLFSLDLIILTKGEKGSRIFQDLNTESIYRPKPVKVIDSVGAGDSYTAAVVMGLLNGFDLETINEIASSVSAYVCTQKGATPVIPKKLIQPFFKK